MTTKECGMREHPVGFMSYVRFDDKHENGRLSQFCERLTGEVRIQTGERFHIFQDRNDIAWGQQWQQRIDDSLDAVAFLIPIITPSFFKSPACRAELDRFLNREKHLGRSDLILPIYYINCPILNNEAKRDVDPLAKVIAARQYSDWRELRFEPLTSPQVGKLLAKIATQIVEALEQGQPERESPPASAAAPRKSRAGVSLASLERMRPSAQPVDIPHRPTPKTEPPTLVVDALHRGDHPTLTAALAAAKPGDRILVRPGFYRESVVIDKPVEIIGDGELGEVVIEGSQNDAILFRATMGRIANLTLRQASGGKHYCVDIAQGRLDLEGCDISSQSLACVAIHGGADPRLRRNRIHDGKASGVI
ncbi:MAG: TIR domain-containing protein, partial [Phycisphaerae bacterium]